MGNQVSSRAGIFLSEATVVCVCVCVSTLSRSLGFGPVSLEVRRNVRTASENYVGKRSTL